MLPLSYIGERQQLRFLIGEKAPPEVPSVKPTLRKQTQHGPPPAVYQLDQNTTFVRWVNGINVVCQRWGRISLSPLTRSNQHERQNARDIALGPCFGAGSLSSIKNAVKSALVGARLRSRA